MGRVATQTQNKAATQKANTKTAKDTGKKGKRAPSAYNVYMGEHLKKWKEDHAGKPIKEGMAAVAAQWRNAPENPNRGKEPATKKAKAPKKAAAASDDEKSDD